MSESSAWSFARAVGGALLYPLGGVVTPSSQPNSSTLVSMTGGAASYDPHLSNFPMLPRFRMVRAGDGSDGKLYPVPFGHSESPQPPSRRHGAAGLGIPAWAAQPQQNLSSILNLPMFMSSEMEAEPPPLYIPPLPSQYNEPTEKILEFIRQYTKDSGIASEYLVYSSHHGTWSKRLDPYARDTTTDSSLDVGSGSGVSAAEKHALEQYEKCLRTVPERYFAPDFSVAQEALMFYEAQLAAAAAEAEDEDELIAMAKNSNNALAAPSSSSSPADGTDIIRSPSTSSASSFYSSFNNPSPSSYSSYSSTLSGSRRTSTSGVGSTDSTYFQAAWAATHKYSPDAIGIVPGVVGAVLVTPAKAAASLYKLFNKLTGAPTLGPSRSPSAITTVTSHQRMMPFTSKQHQLRYGSGNLGASGSLSSSSISAASAPTVEDLNALQLQQRLASYLDMVELTLMQLVGSKAKAFFASLTTIQLLNEEIRAALHLVTTIRASMTLLEQRLVVHSLNVVKNERALRNAMRLETILAMLQTIAKTQSTIKLLLGTSEFAAAIHLVQSTLALIKSDEFKKLTCLKQMEVKLKENLKLIDMLMMAEFGQLALNEMNNATPPTDQSLSSSSRFTPLTRDWLKSSTRLVGEERERFSTLVQTLCSFGTLLPTILKFGTEVHEYVGDELRQFWEDQRVLLNAQGINTNPPPIAKSDSLHPPPVSFHHSTPPPHSSSPKPPGSGTGTASSTGTSATLTNSQSVGNLSAMNSASQSASASSTASFMSSFIPAALKRPLIPTATPPIATPVQSQTQVHQQQQQQPSSTSTMSLNGTDEKGGASENGSFVMSSSPSATPDPPLDPTHHNMSHVIASLTHAQFLDLQGRLHQCLARVIYRVTNVREAVIEALVSMNHTTNAGSSASSSPQMSTLTPDRVRREFKELLQHLLAVSSSVSGGARAPSDLDTPGLVESRCVALLEPRMASHARLDLYELKEVFESTMEFVREMEEIGSGVGGGGDVGSEPLSASAAAVGSDKKFVCLELRKITLQHEKAFLAHMHKCLVTELTTAMERDSWERIDVPRSYQILIDQRFAHRPMGLKYGAGVTSVHTDKDEDAAEMVPEDEKGVPATYLFVENELSHSTPVSSATDTATATRPKSLSIDVSTDGGDASDSQTPIFARYPLTSSTLTLLNHLSFYAECAIHLKGVSTDLLKHITHSLQLFTSRSMQLILGAGAVTINPSQVKVITSKHLSVTSQCLTLIQQQCAVLEDLLKQHFPDKHHPHLRKELLRVTRDYSDHLKEIFVKLETMAFELCEATCKGCVQWLKREEEIVDYNNNLVKSTASSASSTTASVTLPQSTTTTTPPTNDLPTLFKLSNRLLTQTEALYTVLYDYLQPDQRHEIMARIARGYSERFRRYFYANPTAASGASANVGMRVDKLQSASSRMKLSKRMDVILDKFRTWFGEVDEEYRRMKEELAIFHYTPPTVQPSSSSSPPAPSTTVPESSSTSKDASIHLSITLSQPSSPVTLSAQESPITPNTTVTPTRDVITTETAPTSESNDLP